MTYLKTRSNGLKLYKAHRSTDARMVLWTFGILYLQQSFRVVMCLFLNAV